MVMDMLLNENNSLRQRGITEAKLSKDRAVVNLFKGYLGAGLLSLPWALQQVGLVYSLIGMLVIAVLNFYGVKRFIQCDKKNASERYERIKLEGEREGKSKSVDMSPVDYGLGPSISTCVAVGGHPLGIVGSVFVFGAQIGTAAAYNLIIIHTLVDVLGMKKVYASIGVTLAYLILALLPDLSTLSISSAFGLLSYGVVFALLFYEGGHNIYEKGFQPIPETLHYDGVLAWLGIVIWAFEGINTAQSIYKEMDLDDPHEFYDALRIAYMAGFGIYLTTGVVGCLAYGDSVNQLFILNFRPGLMVQLAQLMLVGVLVLTIPIQMYPVYSLFEYVRKFTFVPHWYSMRVMFTGVIIIIGMLVPDPVVVISLVGSVCFGGMGFILPGICHIVTFGLNGKHTIIDLLLVCMGLLAIFVAFWDKFGDPAAWNDFGEPGTGIAQTVGTSQEITVAKKRAIIL